MEAATTEPPTSTTNTVGNGNAVINGDPTLSNVGNQDTNLADLDNGGPLLNGVSSETGYNLPSMNQRDAVDRRQAAHLPIIPNSNDDVDMVDTPTSDNSHSIAEGNSLLPFQVIGVHKDSNHRVIRSKFLMSIENYRRNSYTCNGSSKVFFPFFVFSICMKLRDNNYPGLAHKRF